jgi:hypothetical protein
MRKVFTFFSLIIVLAFAEEVRAIDITSNTNWSTITPIPTSATTIVVTNGAILTLDVTNAVCNIITLGKTNTGNGTLYFSTVSGTITPQLTVSGAVNIGAGNRRGTLDMTEGGILICGNLATQGAINNYFYCGNGSVELTGINTLPATVITTFNNLKISNSTTLGTNITIGGILTLSNGLLNTASTSKLILAATSSISGGSASSYVNGPLDLNTNSTTAKTVHLGSGGYYRTVGIEPATTDATTFSIEYILGNSYGLTVTSPIVSVSTLEHFIINRTSGTTNAKVSLSWGSNSGITNLAAIRVARWNSASWEDAGRTSLTGDETSGTITSGDITTFSPFIIGSTVEQPLPVTLKSFTSVISGRDVKLNWVTEKEINNKGFDVERVKSSESGVKGYEKIGYVESKGNVNTATSYSFDDKNLVSGRYKYRLKQIDYNGNYEYFELNVEVTVGVPKKFDLSQNYPNPFNPVTKINFDIPEDGKVNLRIYDMLGREVATLVNDVRTAGYYTVNFDASRLSSGMYFYRLSAGNYNAVKKMAVIK